MIKMNITGRLTALKGALLSPRGKNVLTFMLFIVIATVLWVVMSLNEEVQQDLKCRLRLVNKPDSVTMVSYMPDAVNVSVKARGTSLIQYHWGDPPVINIDYNYYHRGNTLTLGQSDMRTILRQYFGSGATISNLNPDTLNLIFTTLPPRKLPVVVDSRVTADPTAVISAPPVSLTETVEVYSAEPLGDNVKAVSTYPLELNDMDASRVVKVRLKAPQGCRVVPDSVMVRVEVERLLMTTVSVPITTINVPDDVKMLLFPNRVDVSFLATSTQLGNPTPGFKVIADYNRLSENPASATVPLQIVNEKSRVRGLKLAVDSVKYLIER